DQRCADFHRRRQTTRSYRCKAAPCFDWIPGVYGSRRAGGLRSELSRHVSPRCVLRGQDSQGGKAGRSAGPAANQIRAGGQPQDGQGDRHHDPYLTSSARRRGDRMKDRRCPSLMLWTAPPPARRCHGRRGRPDSEDWTMQAVTTIGVDIAKSIFQVHAVDAEGNVAVRRRLKRRYVVAFFQKLPRCLVGIEACASSHHWARELQAL